MRLRFSATSPYVRKVMVSALETNQADTIEKVSTNPWDSGTDLGEFNPIGKVPALLLESGDVLFDSPVICEYLDSLHQGRKLLPIDHETRFKALRLQAVADGILDAAVLRRLEAKRAEGHRSEAWIARQQSVMRRGLDFLEAHADELEGEPSLGSIAVGCALGYLDFRFSGDRWRGTRPRLAGWFEGFSQRPSMIATEPPADG